MWILIDQDSISLNAWSLGIGYNQLIIDIMASKNTLINKSTLIIIGWQNTKYNRIVKKRNDLFVNWYEKSAYF